MLRKKLRLGEKPEHSSNPTVVNEKTDKNEQNNESPLTTSKYFSEHLWQKIYKVECDLSKSLAELKFPVAAVYNPIEYASEIHCAYMSKFIKDSGVPVLFVGMNPGPWGMCQTGVPFGYIPAIRDWMKLKGNVQKPVGELEVRPVTGLLCAKAEQSGQRFWGLLEEICGEPEVFFENCFVFNYCPLAFFHQSGRNITPAELKGDIKFTLQNLCNQSTQAAINLFSPKIIISIGRYTEDRIKTLFKDKLINGNIIHKCMPHPSPRSLNNTNWNEKALVWLKDNSILEYLTPKNTNS